MVIEQITVRNYRNIKERTVKFSGRGVTVIQGPNEIGKSSLIEALDLILRFQESSSAKEVKAVKPIEWDVGPEVEVILASGQYRFRYFKRFTKDRETVLEVMEPRHEQKTGQDAHNRVQEIIRDTMDETLFHALRIQQGEGVSQTKLSSAPSLQEALDRAAGGNMLGREEMSLFQAIQEEYQRYFTLKTEKPTRTYLQIQKAENEALSALQDIEGQVRHVHESTRQLAQLENNLEEQRARLNEADQQETELKRQLSVIADLEKQIQYHAVQFDRAKVLADSARRRKESRDHLIADVAKLEDKLADRRSSREEAESMVSQAEEAFQECRVHYDQMRQMRDRIRAEVDAARETVAHLQNQETAESILNQINQAREFRGLMAEQQVVLEPLQITEQDIQKIRVQRDRFIRAQAAEETGAARVEAKRLGEFPVYIDQRELGKGEHTAQPIHDPVVIRIPDAVEIVVRPGTSSADLSRTLDRERKILDDLCRSAGATDPAHAESLWQKKKTAQEALKQLQWRMEQVLNGKTLKELEETYAILQSRLENYRVATIRPDQTSPATVTEAHRLLEEQEHTLRDADEQFESFARTWSTTETHYTTWKKMLEKARLEESEAQAQLEDLRNRLIRERTEASDDQVIQEALEASQEIGLKKEEGIHLENRLASLRPDEARVKYDNVAGLVKRLTEAIQEAKQQRERLQGEMETLAGQGLYERKNQALTTWQRARRNLELETQRANAARYLYQKMSEARVQSQQRYREPLEREIEQLGSVLYGKRFAVTLDENLLISQRTLGTATVPFDSLSTGAQEQLTLLARLAAARLVSRGEGVPIILDDALGWTDQSRLESMGAVLNAVGRDCQIIILTCMPSRYGWIGGAHVVNVE